jgi:hypothetical protein
MAPTWLPLCRAMQRYCEAFFAAIESWRMYDEKSLLCNRIHLVESAHKILFEYSQKQENYVFDILVEYSDVPLLQEVTPSAGKDYVHLGDLKAFDSAKKLVPEVIFNRVGAFFQNNLLKALAGFKEDILKVSNMENRKSIVAAVEKLLRLPEDVGMAKFVFKLTTEEEFSIYPQEFISTGGKAFADFLADSKITAPSKSSFKREVKRKPEVKKDTNGQNKRARPTKHETDSESGKVVKKSKKPKYDSDNESEKVVRKPRKPTERQQTPVKKVEKRERNVIPEPEPEPEEVIDWTTDHPSVGKQVASFFLVDVDERFGGKRRNLFFGTVEKYAPETAPDANDQLYHVVWDDGDEEDYEEEQYLAGLELRACNVGWLFKHDAIGTKVAKLLSAEEVAEMKSTRQAKKPSNILCGTVIKVSPAGSVPEHGVDRYYIQWDNDAEEIYTDENLQDGISFLNAEKEKEKNEAELKKAEAATRKAEADAKKAEKELERQKRKEAKKQQALPEATEGDVVENAEEPEDSFVDHSMEVEEEPEKEEEGASDDEPAWTENHDSVGTQVAAVFKTGKRARIFSGKVVKFAPESKPGKNDQLYHIEWEDGDEEDYDDGQLIIGQDLFTQKFGKSAKKLTPSKSRRSRKDEDPLVANGKSSSRAKKNDSKIGKVDHALVTFHDEEVAEDDPLSQLSATSHRSSSNNHSSSSSSNENNHEDDNEDNKNDEKETSEEPGVSQDVPVTTEESVGEEKMKEEDAVNEETAPLSLDTSNYFNEVSAWADETLTANEADVINEVVEILSTELMPTITTE